MCAQIMHVVVPRGCVDCVRLRESALKADSGKRVISCCTGKSNFEQQQQQTLKLGGIPDSSADKSVGPVHQVQYPNFLEGISEVLRGEKKTF